MTQTLVRSLAMAVAALLLPFPAAGDAIDLSSRPRMLNPEQPEQRRVGELLWRGTLEISSADPRFGGFSALRIGADGRTLTALNDKGHWLTAQLRHDSKGHLSGLDQGEMAAYLSPSGRPVAASSALDAESMTVLPDGDWLVGFEWNHRLWRYPAGSRPLTAAPRVYPPPPWLGRVPSNKGMEALVTLPDGGVLAFTEGLERGDGLAAFLHRKNKWHLNSYLAQANFQPTDAGLLPDGDVLVLERRFTLLGGLSARLMRLEENQIKPRGDLTGSELALLQRPLTLDNMEGLAIHRNPAGETLIYLISDDNFNLLQRTLLMLFALVP